MNKVVNLMLWNFPQCPACNHEHGLTITSDEQFSGKTMTVTLKCEHCNAEFEETWCVHKVRRKK